MSQHQVNTYLKRGLAIVDIKPAPTIRINKSRTEIVYSILAKHH